LHDVYLIFEKQIKGDIMKRGEGLSLSTVATAVIVLLVVVVLIIIFSGKMSYVSKSFSGCESKPGAKCITGTAESGCNQNEDGVYYSQKIDFKCSTGQICCYSNCKASGGKCVSGQCNPESDLGPSDCLNGEICCSQA
jgi:hypothetical protein